MVTFNKRVMNYRAKISHVTGIISLFAFLFSYAEALTAQTQGSGNRLFTLNDTRIKLVFVQGGEMTLGCAQGSATNCDSSEMPAHRVTLDDFYIGETEVTQAQWMAVMGRDNNPSYRKGNQLPVERVSWVECHRFITRLNKHFASELPDGYRFALPSEAQWEYAARGGTKSANYIYAGDNNLNPVAWWFENSNERSQDVRCKKANELGLFDMSGNVWEWCEDWYDENYYSENQDWKNPLNLQENTYYVQRGGSWNFGAKQQRCTFRDYGSPHSRYEDCGFRIALVPKSN